MIMLGTIVNVTAIIIGSCIGACLKQKVSNNMQETLFTAMGMCALTVGICAAVNAHSNGGSLVLLIVNMAIGSVCGSMLKLHDRFIALTERFSHAKGLGEGLVSAILLFCIGTLSIVGPMQSALNNDNTMLYTNASLDFITSIALSASFGIGITLSAFALFIFQGSIFTISYIISDTFADYILNNLTLTGGVLIIMSALSLLKLKSIKTTDFLMALFISPITSFIAQKINSFNPF